MAEGHSERLACDARAIWEAGIHAAHPSNLLRKSIRLEENDAALVLPGDHRIDLRNIRRIAIVGAGKASGTMAFALQGLLGDRLLQEKDAHGSINVPGDRAGWSPFFQMNPARPVGTNLPTEKVVDGTNEILRIVESLDQQDLCFCLISGGGGSLLELPADGVTLRDIVEVTQRMSLGGVDIGTMNAVRTAISRVKGGGLARACRAGALIGLILSDVIGDPLQIIACGPTVVEGHDHQRAMPIAKELGLSRTIQDAATRAVGLQQQVSSSVRNVVIGNNASAVNGAAEKARALGYVTSVTDDFPGGDATEVGEALARRGLELLSAGEKRCLVSGGEPTVRGVQPGGHGGRSTHLALAAGQILQDRAGILLASVGTDGEDGPTDAAGAMFFSPVAMRARELGLDPAGYLLRTDSYRFFSEAGGLIETGLTGTNVADLRIVITDGESG